jgi:peroxiredoxin (alkyl hydroperoxide reductase subunit C)
VLQALKTADAFNVATPADWRPGDDVIVGPAGSCGAAKDRMDGKDVDECQDWFFCSRKISAEEIEKGIRK